MKKQGPVLHLPHKSLLLMGKNWLMRWAGAKSSLMLAGIAPVRGNCGAAGRTSRWERSGRLERQWLSAAQPLTLGSHPLVPVQVRLGGGDVCGEGPCAKVYL